MNWKKLICGLGIAALGYGCFAAESKNSKEQLKARNSYTVALESNMQQKNFECKNYYIFKNPNDPAIEALSLDRRCTKFVSEGDLERKINLEEPKKARNHIQKNKRTNQQKAEHFTAKPKINYSNNYIANLVIETANKYGVEPEFALAIAKTESSLNPNSRSKKGAIGIMQLMPGTAKRYNKNITLSNLYNPEINIDIGIRHLDRLLSKYNGNKRLVCAAYNAGEGAVAKYKGVPPIRETQRFVKKVMNNYNN